jgi:hypothetical protein
MQDATFFEQVNSPSFQAVRDEQRAQDARLRDLSRNG